MNRPYKIHPRPYQSECVNTVWDHFVNGGTGNPVLALPTGCHAVGHPILMFDGSIKPVEDVQVGDTLIGPDSEARLVIQLARGNEKMYRIIPTKGESFVVNENHILSLNTTRQRASRTCHFSEEGDRIENVTVKEYLLKSNHYKHTRKLWRSAVEFGEKDLLLQPYDLGLMLGDGSFQGTPAITTEDIEIVEAAQRIADLFDLSLTKVTTPGNSASTYYISGIKGTSNKLSEHLEELNLREAKCEYKFIPHNYKTSSFEQRLYLIAGLIDSDGSKTCNGFDFISKSEELARDLAYVCRSVGLAAYLKPSRKKAQTGPVRTYYRVTISGDTDLVPCMLERKRCTPRKQIKRVNVTGFKVEELTKDCFYGFALSGDHLYLDGNFVVHHNTGKSLIPPLFMQRAFGAYPQSRMLMLTHVKELVEQNRQALLRVMPTAPIGIYSAGLGKKEPGAPIVYGSVQSVKNAVKLLGRRDMLWIDEAHLLSPKEGTMYQDVIAQLRETNPAMPVVGMSATPFRTSQGMLTDPTFDKDGNKKKPIFDKIVFDITGVKAFNRLIDERYLSPLVPKETDVVIDITDVRWLGSELNQGDLNATIKKQNITAKAIAQSIELLADRKSIIVFGAGIENCLQITEMLTAMGQAACCVHSKMKDHDRDRFIKGFKAGAYRWIVSNRILTTGFDHPPIDGIVDLNPSISVVNHIQKYGRGTRPYFHPSYSFEHLRVLENRINAMAMAGKLNCKVLDFAGNTMRLGPINDPVIPSKKKKPGTGEVPIKLCPECKAYNHTAARECCDCGHEFVFKTKLKPNASTAELIRRDETQIEIWDVGNRFAFLNKGKNGKADSVRVQYFSGIQSVNMWLGFGEGIHGMYKHRSHDWWRQHSPNDPPQSVTEALERFSECRETKQIKVNTAGKYAEVLECLF